MEWYQDSTSSSILLIHHSRQESNRLCTAETNAKQPLKLKMGKKSKTGSCQSRTIFIDENRYHATDFEENYPENEASACIIPLLLSEMLELVAAVKEPIRNERQPVLGSRRLLSASTAMKTSRCRSLQPPANVLFTDVGFYVILCCWV